MMTSMGSNGVSKRKRSTGALLAAIFWAIESCMAGAQLAWGQRKDAEPEANPQFQQDVQGSAPSTVGQPVDSGQTSQPQPSPTPDQTTSAIGVQIGGDTTEKKPLPAAPTNPLDVKVSIRVRDASLATFLEIISNQAKVNFIMTEGLKNKTVTAFLQNVTVREALQILLEIKGLTYQQIGKSNTYIIRERTKDVPLKITRIYTLNYAPLVPILTQNGSNQNQASGSQVLLGSMAASQSGGNQYGMNQYGGNQYGGNQQSRFQGGGDSGIAIYQIIKGILTKEGEVAIDARTNSLVVTDIPEVFPQVEQIIAELDKKAPQVMIEAQIVEIDSDKTKNLGLEWGSADGTLASFTGPQRDTSFPLNLQNNLSKTQFFGPITNVISSVGTTASSGANNVTTSGNVTTTTGVTPINNLIVGSSLQTGVVNLSQLTVILRALVSHSEARFLGKPKVLALNNMAAIIGITQNTAVANQANITGAQGVAQTTTSVERHTTGVILRVTPQVNKEGFITLLVQPEYTNVIESAISSATNPVFDPLTRSESTLVRVKNGQTLVLGGLLSSQETKEVRKVPFFGYIPLIGWLFTSTTSDRKNTDLVIFLTPTLVND